MALRHSAFYSPLLMTMAGGFLKAEGLDYTYAQATPEKTVPGSIANGTCHVAQSAVATKLIELEQGVQNDVVHFAQINDRDGFFLAAREPDDNFEWKKLIGKRVLVDHFFQPLAMFKYALFKQGIDASTIEFIDAGNVDDMDKVFRDGVGDYVHQQGPAPQQLEFDGEAHVVASVGQTVGPVAFSSLCASREWCASPMAAAFRRAYKASLAYVIDEPAKDIAQQEIAAGFFPSIQPDVLVRTIADYQALGCWENDATISEASFQALQDVFAFNGQLSRRYAYDDIIVRQEW